MAVVMIAIHRDPFKSHVSVYVCVCLLCCAIALWGEHFDSQLDISEPGIPFGRSSEFESSRLSINTYHPPYLTGGDIPPMVH